MAYPKQLYINQVIIVEDFSLGVGKDVTVACENFRLSFWWSQKAATNKLLIHECQNLNINFEILGGGGGGLRCPKHELYPTFMERAALPEPQ